MVEDGKLVTARILGSEPLHWLLIILLFLSHVKVNSITMLKSESEYGRQVPCFCSKKPVCHQVNFMAFIQFLYFLLFCFSDRALLCLMNVSLCFFFIITHYNFQNAHKDDLTKPPLMIIQFHLHWFSCLNIYIINHCHVISLKLF